MRLTRSHLQDVARTLTWHNSKTDFVTDLLEAIGLPEGFTVQAAESPTPVRKGMVTTIVTMRQEQILVCISVLRERAVFFSDANNRDAALACRNLAERLYLATDQSEPEEQKPAKPTAKTRYDRIGGDDE